MLFFLFKKFFRSLALIIFIALPLFFADHSDALAAGYTLQMPLPGMPASISDPGEYVKYLFTFGLMLVGFLAVGAIVAGGILWMTAGTIGNVEKGKKYIWGAI
ncbi:MAG: hypothetical protein AAB724_02590, partial [Patescibacteria group bacterium]